MDQVGEQVAGRAIGPVDVLDDEEHRPVDRESLPETEHHFEEPGRATVGSAVRS